MKMSRDFLFIFVLIAPTLCSSSAVDFQPDLSQLTEEDLVSMGGPASPASPEEEFQMLSEEEEDVELDPLQLREEDFQVVEAIQQESSGNPYAETSYGKDVCPAGYDRIFDEAECKEARVATGKRWAGAHSWDNIQGGCFSHPNKHVWFNKNKNGRIHGAFSSVCKFAGGCSPGWPQIKEVSGGGTAGTTVTGKSQGECAAACAALATCGSFKYDTTSQACSYNTVAVSTTDAQNYHDGDTVATCKKVFSWSQTVNGSAACPTGMENEVTDEATCKDAGAALGSKWGGASSWNNVPSGCTGKKESTVFNFDEEAASTSTAFSKICSSLPSLVATWKVISATKGCESNSDGIKKKLGEHGHSLASCKSKCQAMQTQKKGCVAIDFYKESTYCVFYDKACTTPRSTHHRVSSYSMTVSTTTGPSKPTSSNTGTTLTTTPSLTTVCAPGICTKGKWALYFGGTTEAQCKAKCDETRTFISVPDGVQEDVYNFQQNGRFHDITAKTPSTSRKTKTINYPGTGSYWKDWRVRDHFYVRWSGYIEIKAAGRYTFNTKSDDGSRLYINDIKVTDNGGWHGMRDKRGSVDLAAGKHKFWAEMFEGGGGAGMELKYNGPDTGGSEIIVPENVLSSSLTGPKEKMFNPEHAALGMCQAYSHNGKECVIYSSCTAVAPAVTEKDLICEDNSFDWVEPSTLTTCKY